MRLRTSAGAYILSLGINDAGRLPTDGPVSGASASSVVVSLGVWHELQLHSLVADTASTQEVWLDGAKVAQLSKTTALGVEPIGQIDLGDSSSAHVFDVAFDDVVADTGFVDTTSPTTPTGLATTSVLSNRVDLAWNPLHRRGRHGRLHDLPGRRTDRHRGRRDHHLHGPNGVTALGLLLCGRRLRRGGEPLCPESPGGCGRGSLQDEWLRADLAAHPATCTLAYWHQPRSSSGYQGNNNTQQFWEDLYAAGADLVLNGHSHDYERFAPQNPARQADPLGIREMIVGTGGADQIGFNGRTKPNSEVRNSGTFGILELTLHQASYDWTFVPEAGGTFTDSGSTACHQ